MIADYFQYVEKLLHACPLTVSIEVQTEIIDIGDGYLKAKVRFIGGSELHLFELVRIENNRPVVEKYRYHYQNSNRGLVKRWDNAKHHPEIKTFPDHVHVGNKVQEAEKPQIEDVLVDVVNAVGIK